MTNVTVVIGAGLIGQAIARRVSTGKHVLLADLRQEHADVAANVLGDAGFTVSTAVVDVSSRASVHALVETATAIGPVTGVIYAAGVSPTQASPGTILKVDLCGTALVLEEFGNVIAQGGAGDGRGSAVGQTRRAGQYDQPRHYLHPSRQGGAGRSAWPGISPHARTVAGGTYRHSG